jgi:hypothetical protein
MRMLQMNPGLSPLWAVVVLAVAARAEVPPVSFNAPAAVVIGQYTAAVAVGDFNGDGIPDMAIPSDI